jgi:hypothetical protein
MAGTELHRGEVFQVLAFSGKRIVVQSGGRCIRKASGWGRKVSCGKLNG